MTLGIMFTGIAVSATLNEELNISVHLGSYSIHLTDNGDHTEGFSNKLFSVGYPINKFMPYIDGVLIGTAINSSGNRCALIGIEKNYIDFSKQLSFEGSYTYVGEFFFSAFEKCGDDGIYETIKRKIGIGFAPFIYHGLEYDISKYISLEAGIILPDIALFSIQYNF